VRRSTRDPCHRLLRQPALLTLHLSQRTYLSLCWPRER
jgi:hypothetical protein